MKIKYFIYSLILLLSSQSCDIDEKVFDEIVGDNPSGDVSQDAVLAPSYSSLRDLYGHRSLFALSVYSTDEGMLPLRLSDWFDGGVFQQLQQHSWEPTHEYVTRVWDFSTSGIGRSLSAINLLPNGSQAEAEATALLGFYMMTALDNFNVVPFREITDNIDFDAPAQILQGADAVNQIIAVVESAMPNLSDEKNTVRFTRDAAKSLLARLYLNKAVYVDRTGSASFDPADMAKVISLSNEIISGGLHTLEGNDYFTMFNRSNENHPEIIFGIRNETNSAPVIGGDSVTRNATNGMSRGLLLTDLTRGGSYLGGSDAGCTLAEFYDTWAQGDPRMFKQEIEIKYENVVGFPGLIDNDDILGQLKALPLTMFFTNIVNRPPDPQGIVRIEGDHNLEAVAGDILIGNDAVVRTTAMLPKVRWTVPIAGVPFVNRGFLNGIQFGPYIEDSQVDALRGYHYVNGGQDVVFSAMITKGAELAVHTREVQYLAGSQTTGVRVLKWEIDISRRNRDDTDVDIPVFRLAETYLNRAEAKFRSGDVGGALIDINTLRTARRQGGLVPANLGSVSLQDILDERGFEFYWEYHRRTDQIRFGKWEDAWESKSSADPAKRLYPIPTQVVAFNPGIDQNPGY